MTDSGINYLWILINSIYNFWTIFNLGLFLIFILIHTFDLLTLHGNIAYVNFKIDCTHIERQIYVTYKKNSHVRHTNQWMCL